MSHTIHHMLNTDVIIATFITLRNSNIPKSQAIIETFKQLGYTDVSDYAKVYRICNNWELNANERKNRSSSGVFEGCAV